MVSAAPWDWLFPAGAALFAAAMGLVVLRAGPGNRLNRRLVLVLALETLMMSAIAVLNFAFEVTAQPRALTYVVFVAFCSLPAAYLYFLGLLATPLTARLRSPWAAPLLALAVVPFALAGWFVGTPTYDPPTPGIAIVTGASGAFMLGASVYAIIVSISAARRTRPGTALRRQAVAFAAAFITRDVLWVGVTTVLFAIWTQGEPELSLLISSAGPAVTALAYVPILAYGILQTQLFDIDLKIKLGIKRSTVATIMLLAVFGAAKTAEFYLNTTYGFIAGGIAAGAVLFLAPRLNRLGDKVASTAMPRTQDTSAYREFRKLEVYKAALESALEGGEITEKERGTLDRLRARLGVKEEDARLLEHDLAEATASA